MVLIFFCVCNVGIQLGIMKLQSTGAHQGEKGESSRKVESRNRQQRSSTLEEEEC